MENITIYGHLDGDLKRTVQILRKNNVGVVIYDEQELHLIRRREENARLKGKKQASSSKKGKEKENSACQVNDNVISKAKLAQRARRERERNEVGCSKRQMAQRLRRERERSGECIQPKQPRFFPSLIPSRRRRLCLERRTMTTDVIQSTSVLTEFSENAQKRAMVTHASGSSSITTLLPKTPNQVDNSVCGRTPLTMDTHLNSSNHVDLHSMHPPRNLGEEFIAANLCVPNTSLATENLCVPKTEIL